MDIRMSNIASPMPQIRAKFTNKLGIPLSGCKVYTYEPNSDIPKTTWLDADKTTENTNPILLDAAGEADIFLDGLYRVVVKDRFGFVVYDVEKTGNPAQWDASFVIDATGQNQQKINDGVASLDELRLINPKTKGRRIYLNSVIAGKDLGGGIFVSTQKAGLVDNGGTIVATPSPSLFWVRINYDVTTPQMFGALGDNENDDRLPFQSAVDFLRNTGGGELYVPQPKNNYLFKSYDNVNNCALLLEVPISGIYGRPVTLRGAGRDVSIRLDLGLSTTIDSMVLLKGGGSFKSFENLTFWGGPSSALANCNYILKGIDTYYPDFDMSNCQFYSAVESTVRLATYVSTFNKVRGAYAKKFMHITGPEGNLNGEVTALNFNSCYGLNVTENSIYLGTATYCNLNACAADHVLGENAYPYHITLARGVAFNGCGAESSDRIMHIGTAQGVTINGLMTLFVGNDESPPTELIRIDGGASVTIAGLWNQAKKASQCILRLGGNFSTESVTVLDQSLEPSDVIAPSNFTFQNPVRFLLRDFSRKTQEITLTNTGNATTNTTNFRNAVRNAYDTCLLHDVIVRFPSGDFNVNDIVYLSSGQTRGDGRIRLIGNADGTSRLVITGDGIVSFGRPNSVNAPNFAVENLALHMSAPTGSTKGVQLYKGTTTFTNGKITSDNGARQYYAESNPVLKIGAGSYIATAYFGDHDVQFTYKATTAPTNSTHLPAGTIFKASDPNATRVGWINTTEGGATWLALTP